MNNRPIYNWLVYADGFDNPLKYRSDSAIRAGNQFASVYFAHLIYKIERL